MAKFLDSNGLLYYNQKLDTKFNGKVDKVEGKGLSTNDYTAAEKTKLAGLSNYDDTEVRGLIGGKVDKVDGKGLSTNDYTTTEKTKLNGIAEGAEVNVIESITVNGTTATITNKAASVTIDTGLIDVIKVNGTTQPITDKTVDITVPTNNNQLTNGAGYQTSSEVQSAINSAISGITQFDYEVVASLPTTGVKGKIYLVPNSGSAPNTYDEYIWIVPQGESGKFEKIGTTAIDLSGYWAKADLVAMTNAEIDAILAQ